MAALITEAVAVLTLAWLGRGVQKLTGENLKVIWAEFSTFKLGHFVMYAMAWYIQKHALA
jgi:hypothetical protein